MAYEGDFSQTISTHNGFWWTFQSVAKRVIVWVVVGGITAITLFFILLFFGFFSNGNVAAINPGAQSAALGALGDVTTPSSGFSSPTPTDSGPPPSTPDSNPIVVVSSPRTISSAPQTLPNDEFVFLPRQSGSSVVVVPPASAPIFIPATPGSTLFPIGSAAGTGGGGAGASTPAPAPSSPAPAAPIPVSIVVIATDKTYDGTNTATPTPILFIFGILPADAGLVSATFTSATFASSQGSASPQVVTVSGIALTGTSSGNYILATTTATTSAFINPAAQTISFTAIPTKTYGDGNFDLDASSTSALAVAFAASGTCSLIPPKTVHIESAGSCDIKASQGGDISWSAASDVTNTFSISQKTISVNVSADDKTYDAGSAASTTLSLVGVVGTDNVFATSTGSVFETASASTSPLLVTVSGISLVGTAVGNYTLSSNSATAHAHITPASQTISFSSIPSKTYGDNNFDLDASSTSNLVVTFEASGTCSVISPKTVHILSAGLCDITASQIGNGNWSSAPNTSRSFTISPKPLSVNVLADSKPYDGGTTASTTLTLSGVFGTDEVFATSTGSNFESADASTSPLIVTVSGITLFGASSTNYSVSNSAATTSTISKASQNITFTDPGVATTTDAAPLTLVAVASSSLPVTFSTDPAVSSVCSVSADVLTILTTGTCTIIASQGGDQNYDPTSDVGYDILVTAPSGGGGGGGGGGPTPEIGITSILYAPNVPIADMAITPRFSVILSSGVTSYDVHAAVAYNDGDPDRNIFASTTISGTMPSGYNLTATAETSPSSLNAGFVTDGTVLFDRSGLPQSNPENPTTVVSHVVDDPASIWKTIDAPVDHDSATTTWMVAFPLIRFLSDDIGNVIDTPWTITLTATPDGSGDPSLQPITTKLFLNVKEELPNGTTPDGATQI